MGLQEFPECDRFNLRRGTVDGPVPGHHDDSSAQGRATYFNNIRGMYNSAKNHGVQLQLVVFPKWKFGGEYCYLYNRNSPTACPVASGTTRQWLTKGYLKLMNFAQTLSGPCTAGTYNRPVAVWYGWGDVSPGYAALKSFWQSLPQKGLCEWLQPASGIHHVVGYSLFRHSRSAAAAEIRGEPVEAAVLGQHRAV